MSSLVDIDSHVRDVLNIVNNQPASCSMSHSVAQSWTRCLVDFGLDPGRFVLPPVLTQHELNLRREAAGDLIACSKLEMTTLYQQLADPELAVILVDANGVIVHQVSSVPFGEAVAADGLRPGAVWSEREAGTNGMGTCLTERECLAIYQHEHFYPRYTSLTCSAAPIFDERGAIVGVLDVTSRSRMLQQHSLVLVGMSRQMIENRLIDSRYRRANTVHFHSRPEFVGTLHAGKLAVDDDGIVLAANRSALFQLDLRSPDQLCGKRIEEAFSATLEDMIARSIRGSFHPITVYSAHASNRFFVIAQTPRDATSFGNANHVATSARGQWSDGHRGRRSGGDRRDGRQEPEGPGCHGERSASARRTQRRRWWLWGRSRPRRTASVFPLLIPTGTPDKAAQNFIICSNRNRHEQDEQRTANRTRGNHSHRPARHSVPGETGQQP